MTQDEFNQAIKELEAVVGTPEGDELFNQLYGELLIRVAKEEDERTKRAHATRMRLLAVIQGQYLLNEWAKAKAEHDANEVTECET